MSLKHAIIALLDLEKGTGYDLVKRFNESVGHFWPSSHQQVYKELHRLHAEGLVEFEAIEQQGKPDKKIYTPTTKGRQALAEWVKLPAKPLKIKDPLLIKLFAGRYSTAEDLKAELARHEQHHEKIRSQFLQLEQQMEQATDAIRKRYLLPYMTLRLGIHLENAWFLWVEEVKAHLSVTKFNPRL